MKRILGISGIRSDYDLMSSLYKRLNADPEIDFRLLVGGAHLSKTYGHTVNLILNDQIKILATVENLIDADTPSSRIKSASIFLQSAVDIVSNWNPDLVIYPGDREEVWIGAVLGTYLDIPTVHFYGGDHTQTGHVDNPIRHAVSKLSTFHAVSIEEHRERLIAMGEPDSRIAVIGSLALDNFVDVIPKSWEELSIQIGIPKHFNPYALVLFHPDPSERASAEEICHNIIEQTLKSGLHICVGYPNTDPANKSIIQVLESYRNNPNVFIYRNLPRENFISLYKNASLIIGNSSSGIMEAASIPIPAINVGLRQRGRLAGSNVVFCDGNGSSIADALAEVKSAKFMGSLASLRNPYGDGRSGEKAYNLIKSTDFNKIRLKTEDALRHIIANK